mmetsp:Transcript_90447/g.269915  ORF Transcript_90447/g.269915 Transcript_90447/m.269915 type:complete len:209 (-) Transcript_90447:745-1371(-)
MLCAGCAEAGAQSAPKVASSTGPSEAQLDLRVANGGHPLQGWRHRHRVRGGAHGHAKPADGKPAAGAGVHRARGWPDDRGLRDSAHGAGREHLRLEDRLPRARRRVVRAAAPPDVRERKRGVPCASRLQHPVRVLRPRVARERLRGLRRAPREACLPAGAVAMDAGVGWRLGVGLRQRDRARPLQVAPVARHVPEDPPRRGLARQGRV